jgi:hypothetical protein
MHAEIDTRRRALAEVCRHYGVARLDVFGSAARGADFNPLRSDLDFLVRFESKSKLKPLNRFFGLTEALEKLFGRPIDLIEESAVQNPYLRAGIERSRELVYGA